jgi:hypothetical protein
MLGEVAADGRLQIDQRAEDTAAEPVRIGAQPWPRCLSGSRISATSAGQGQKVPHLRTKKTGTACCRDACKIGAKAVGGTFWFERGGSADGAGSSPDSLLEGDGFEPSVPRTDNIFSRPAPNPWICTASSAVVGHPPSTSALSRALPQATGRDLPPIMGTHIACTVWEAERVKFANRPRQNSRSVLGSWLPAAVAQALAL